MSEFIELVKLLMLHRGLNEVDAVNRAAEVYGLSGAEARERYFQYRREVS